MEEENFVANSKGDVKALGMKINCAPADLHIYVNGVDITKNVVLERAHACMYELDFDESATARGFVRFL